MKDILFFLFALLLLSVFSSVYGAEGELTARIRNVSVSGSEDGGSCMAKLSLPVNQASNFPDCPDNWVNLGCNSAFTSKEMAFRMLYQAQMALALNKKVVVAVDDARKIGDMCYAYRIDVVSR